MSIYSGFATRQQQQAYDSIVSDLIEVLQRRLVKFYANENADQLKFHSILSNIQTHLVKMEESKYLEPKVSNLFREILVVTAAVAEATRETQSTSQIKLVKQSTLQKQSMSFASEKLSNDLKNYSVGKIRHQLTNKEDGLSSPGQANPQLLIVDKSIKVAASTYFCKDPSNKREVQRWGAMFDQPMAVPHQPQKKNIQYIIRQYMSRGRNRKKVRR